MAEGRRRRSEASKQRTDRQNGPACDVVINDLDQPDPENREAVMAYAVKRSRQNRAELRLLRNFQANGDTDLVANADERLAAYIATKTPHSPNGDDGGDELEDADEWGL